jgi:hypothetical protein
MILLDSIEFNFSNINNDVLILSLVGYTIVFLALALLYAVFHNLPKVLRFNLRRHLHKKGHAEKVIEDITITGEVSAAISTAIHLFFSELHDEEAHVLTINKISKRYAPWSSKIYNVTRGLDRRF